MTTTLEPAHPAGLLGSRPGRSRRWLAHPIVLATAAAAALNLLWALLWASNGGDLAAQYAWTRFAVRHPGGAYDFAWYGGMHPASYSLLAPYLMAVVGVRTAAAAAGTLSAGLVAFLLVRSGVSRPLASALWGAFSLSCNALSGRVTFAVGLMFGLMAVTVVFVPRGPRWARGAAVLALGVLATAASPVAGLFLEVVAAALFLTRRWWPGAAVAAGPPLVVGASALFFPFTGVQPFAWYLVAAPLVSAVSVLLLVPKAWRTVRAGALVYAVGTVLTWAIPSQVGSNVDRLELLFAGVVLLAAALHLRTAALCAAFGATVIAQVARPVFDVVNTAAYSGHSSGVRKELRRLRADRGRVEVVPERTHLESYEFSSDVELARGWNRQADVQRNPLFYNGALTPAAYHAWLRKWAVGYVVLPAAQPDWAAGDEARLVRSGLPWLRQVWHDPHWRVYRVTDAVPLADPPATVEHAGDGEIDVSVPVAGPVLIRVAWSPWLSVSGGGGCLAQAGDWTRLYAHRAGVFRISAPYRVPRGSPCHG